MSTELYCYNCTEYERSIEKLNAPGRLLFARNPETYKGYDGAMFKFCPWCGTRLAVKGAEPERLIS